MPFFGDSVRGLPALEKDFKLGHYLPAVPEIRRKLAGASQ
jgi:hypothetical protein